MIRKGAGIAELIILAERGREDFPHQAGNGDHSPDGIGAMILNLHAEADEPGDVH